MAGPNSAFTDIIATTLQGYSGTIADNVSKNRALLRQIDKKGNKMPATGRSIVQELEYAENSTVMWYSGAEKFDVSNSETMTAAEFPYKQLVGSVTVTGLEEIQNSGKEAIHNLVKSRTKNLDKSLRNVVGRDIYGNGTANNGKAISGLGLLVADIPTNVVGGIDANVFSFWRNVVYDFSTLGVTLNGLNLLHAINVTWLKVTRGADKPDMGVADANMYTLYMEQLQPQQRFTDDKGAGAGFTNLTYNGNCPIIYDDLCPVDHLYLLNTDYLFLRPAKGKEFVPLGDRATVNQDAIVMPVTWAGNMTTSNRSLQAVICA